MSSIVVEDLSVKFRIYHDRSPSLKDYFANLLRGNRPSAYSDFWAVKEVSFALAAGDRVGIIGHNGAGKSTLLKAMCRVYESDFGKVTVKGRIAPLLEIGAGFHPEFTGRENIYLNGAILGYTRAQLAAVENEVIAFAELEEFIDTPVKYYSTGMYMRLAFALATAVHPDILVLDEVFAGGDARFVAKARQRIRELVNKADIMIMVSHDADLVRAMCNRILWLDHGMLAGDGPVDSVLPLYLAERAGGK
jgi:ABC-type polysaccharide/polyol phosphate transport system ATPase subunit